MKSKTLIRVVSYMLVYLGVPVVASMVKNETVASVLGIVYIFLLIPFGILRMIDFYRTNDGTTVLSRVFNILFRVPLALFGAVCLVAGVAIIGWVLYNVFVDRRKEYSGPGFVFGLGSFGVGVPLVLYGWFTLRSAVRRKEELSPQERVEFNHEKVEEEEIADARERSNIQSEERMTFDRFWNIIEKVHRDSGGDMDRKCKLLAAELRRLTLAEVRSFHRHFDECEDRAYTWELWAAAYIIGGGCSDDAFSDFRATLISMGRQTFERALADPQSHADMGYDAKAAHYEGYQYVPAAVEKELGSGQRFPRYQPHPDEPSGKRWDEDKVVTLYPRLAKKYGYSG
jgi:hypothetical protein